MRNIKPKSEVVSAGTDLRWLRSPLSLEEGIAVTVPAGSVSGAPGNKPNVVLSGTLIGSSQGSVLREFQNGDTLVGIVSYDVEVGPNDTKYVLPIITFGTVYTGFLPETARTTIGTDTKVIGRFTFSNNLKGDA